MTIFDKIVKKLGFDPNDRAIAKYQAKADIVDSYEEQVKKLSDEELANSARIYKERVKNGETLDDILPEVFARVREVSVRKLGLRHYREQLIGAMALSDGNIAEMKTGEGKTLVATLAVALNAMSDKGTHVITVNDYLAKRDAEWMRCVYEGMGLSVGVITPSVTDEERVEAYKKDITYGTNSEFGFDYLRDNMAVRKEQQVQRGHYFCLVDEVDSILIDEARTPLIISGPSEDDTEPYMVADRVARQLVKDRDFEVEEKDRNLALTEEGIARAEEILDMPNLFTDFEHSSLAHKIVQALKAHQLFIRDIHYVIKKDEVIIVDEFTGRLMEGRRFSDGLHQAIEAKENVQIGKESQTLATVTLQNYFRMYKRLAGMTGTALTEAEEFEEIYGLKVIVVPTHKPMARIDRPDAVYRTIDEKYHAVADAVAKCHELGQPVLVGTTSIENSEKISKLLKGRKIPHNVLNAKVHEREASIVAQAGRLGAVTVATNMAGRGTDIVLGGNAEFMAKEEMEKRELSVEDNKEEYKQIFEEYSKVCEEEQKRVLELGGLNILGTERHESRRIDNQLRGRAGRQGDPGESRFYIALEDDLIRLFGGDRIQGLMEKLGMEKGECIEHPLLSRTIENAQKKVEEMHFDIRKQLLGFDNVMNQQREAVYKEREDILTDSNMLERMREVIEDTSKALLGTLFGMDDNEELSEKINRVSVKLNSIYWPGISKYIEKIERETDLQEAESNLLDAINSKYNEKIEGLGEEVAGNIARFIFLQVLDRAWKEHLLAMDELRKGIGFRAVGQKDPLLEYQFESFNLFQQMLIRVREEITEFAFRVSVVTETPVQNRNEWIERHEDADEKVLNFNHATENPGKVATDHVTAPIVKGDKVGRNDPCPCGSGKKYKHCCGRNA